MPVWTSLEEAYAEFHGYISSLEGVNSITQIAQGAGVFRVNDLLTGNTGDPRDTTNPYTGTFMVYPPITLPNGDTADIGGMNAGVIQWYGNSSNGKFYTASGGIIQDDEGLHITEYGAAIGFEAGYWTKIGTMPQMLTGDPAFIIRSSSRSGSNLVANGDFETGDLTNWTTSGTPVVSSSIFKNGLYSVELQKNISVTDSITTAAMTVTAEREYLISLWAKGSGQLNVEVNNASTYAVFMNSDEWTKVEFAYYVPAGDTSIDIKLSRQDTGTTYVDDVEMVLAHSTIELALDPSAGRFVVHSGLIRQVEGTKTHNQLSTNAASSDNVFNEQGLDIDTRIEGDTDANLFFADASTDRVGIGMNNPAEKLDVTGNIKASGTITGSGGALSSVVAETNANDIFNVASPGGVSAFAGTIATLPGGAVLTYNVTSGQELAMVPVSTSQLAKMRLYNTTRGTSALISNVVAATNTITLTANVPAGWATTDVITIASQTVSGGGLSWVDLEIASGPTGKDSLFVNVQAASGTPGDGMRLHPFDASFSASKFIAINALVAGLATNGFGLQKMTSNVFSLAWSGTPSAVVVREAGYIS